MKTTSLVLILAACTPDTVAPVHADPAANAQTGGPTTPTLPQDPCLTITVVQALATPPHQLAPLSTSRSTSRAPRFAWELKCAGDGELQVCGDRDCASVLSTTPVAKGEYTPPAGLSGNGDVYFWRVRSVISDRTGVWSKIWEVVVPTKGTPASTSGGTVLDLDLDGLVDYAVGADSAGVGGIAYVYNTALGVTKDPTFTLTQPVPQPSAVFGGSLASAGDVNGDGYPELIVGANGADEGSSVGAAYLFYGGSRGYVDPPTVLTGPAAADGFGYAVGAAGDVNGDGYADVVVGAPAYGGGKEGAAYVFLGRHAELPDHTPPAFELFGSGTFGSEFGVAVAGVGDLDGDGFGDLAVGESYFTYWLSFSPVGQAFVWYGGAAGPTGTPVQLQSPDAANSDGFGYSLSGATDLNHDGFHDLVVGSGGSSNNDGAVYVWYGSAAGIGVAAPDQKLSPQPPVSGFFGHALSATGDLNGDGTDDLVIGETDANRLAGQVQVFLSDNDTIGPATIVEAPWDTSMYFGGSVAIVGDVDGDDFDDFLVGSPDSEGAGGEADLFPWDGSPEPTDAVVLGPVGGRFGTIGR